MVCGLISLGELDASPGSSPWSRRAGPRMKVPWMTMPSSWQSLVKRRRHLDPHALLDVVQNLLVAGFVADEEQPQPVVLEHFKRLPRHVGLGVAGPDDAELAQFLGDRFGARQVVGEGVVVEEEFPLPAGKRPVPISSPRPHVRRAHAVAVAAHRLRPEAEGAARFAAAPRVERNIRVLQIADEVVLHHKVALVDRALRRAAHPYLRESRGPRCGR